jgi:hypothetical protein
MPKGTSIHDVDTYTDADDNIETAAQIVGTEEQASKKSRAKSSAKKSKPKNDATKSSAKKPKPKDKPTVADSSTTTEEQPAPKKTIEALTTAKAIPSCPVDLFIPADYHFCSRFISYTDPNYKKKKEICIALTPIVPVRKFKNPVTNIVTYEVAILTDFEWEKVEIEGRTLADPRAIISLSDRGALILEPKLVCRFLSEVIHNNATLPKIKSFNQTGWTTEDCEDFAFPTADADSVVRRGKYNYEKIFKPKGNADEWLQKFKEVTEQGGAIARCVIGAALAAPIVRPLGLPNVQVHLHGRKSSGKTPLNKFAISTYGNPASEFAMSFNSTAKARSEAAEAFADLPLFIDEIEALNKFESDRLSEEIYNYSCGVGRVGLTKNGERRETGRIYGTRLTTGEHAITKANDNGGALKRVLNLRMTNPFDENFAADLHGFCERNHGLFAAQWLKYVKSHKEQIAKDFHKALAIAQSKKIDVDDTQLKSLLVSLIAYQHFKICIGLVADNQEIGADADDIIRTLPTTAEMDDSTRALEFLRDFIVGHEKYFWRTMTIDGQTKDYCHNTNEGYGKIMRTGNVAFLKSPLLSILEKEGGFRSGEKIITEWRDKGYIHNTPGRKDYLAKIDGKLTPTIRIDHEKIASAVSSMSDDNPQSGISA